MPERFEKINWLYIAPTLGDSEISSVGDYLGARLINPLNYGLAEISSLGKDIKTLLEIDYRNSKLSPELSTLLGDGMCDAIWDYQLWRYFMPKE